MLLDRLADQVDVAGDVAEIKRAGERASRLTSQLLAFSRRQPSAPRIVDLNQVVGDLEKLLRRIIGEDIVLDLMMAPSLGPTHVDPSQVEQVLMNLVVNARDAMPRGGRLHLSTADVVPAARAAGGRAARSSSRRGTSAVRRTSAARRRTCIWSSG